MILGQHKIYQLRTMIVALRTCFRCVLRNSNVSQIRTPGLWYQMSYVFLNLETLWDGIRTTSSSSAFHQLLLVVVVVFTVDPPRHWCFCQLSFSSCLQAAAVQRPSKFMPTSHVFRAWSKLNIVMVMMMMMMMMMMVMLWSLLLLFLQWHWDSAVDVFLRSGNFVGNYFRFLQQDGWIDPLNMFTLESVHVTGMYTCVSI